MGNVDLGEIGKRISKRRKELGFTQEYLAERMEVSIQMVSNLERGNKAIRIDNLVRLCEILQVSADFILTGVERPSFSDNAAKLSFRDGQMIRAMIEFCLQHPDREQI